MPNEPVQRLCILKISHSFVPITDSGSHQYQRSDTIISRYVRFVQQLFRLPDELVKQVSVAQVFDLLEAFTERCIPFNLFRMSFLALSPTICCCERSGSGA